MTVASILKEKGRDVITVSAQSTLLEAANMLSQHNIGALIVIDDQGAVAGILSERDLVRMIANCGPECLSQPVSQHMTANVFTCSSKDSVQWLMSEMTRRRIRHLPVVDNGKLTGIVSIGDVVKRRIADAELQAEAMREYIATG